MSATCCAIVGVDVSCTSSSGNVFPEFLYAAVGKRCSGQVFHKLLLRRVLHKFFGAPVSQACAHGPDSSISPPRITGAVPVFAHVLAVLHRLMRSWSILSCSGPA